jgi:hypothetical protein
MVPVTSATEPKRSWRSRTITTDVSPASSSEPLTAIAHAAEIGIEIQGNFLTHYLNDIMDERLAEPADVQRLIDGELAALKDLIESCTGAEITSVTLSARWRKTPRH